MLGITRISNGRLGNRLFHYHFLRQLSEKTGIKYYHCSIPESKYFEDMGKINLHRIRFNKKIKFNSKDILNYSIEDFLEILKEETYNKNDIILEPPILGELFFDYLFFKPGNFIKVKRNYQKEFNFVLHDDIKVIGIHIRGGDFPQWNEKAALKFSYYKNAISYCADYFKDNNPVFILFTDDCEYPAYIETKDYLMKCFPKNCYFGNNNDLPIFDFYQITQCDILISSPSTFAIFAGCLGKTKKIIHNKEWIDYSLCNNDKFWVDFINKPNPYYTLWKTF